MQMDFEFVVIFFVKLVTKLGLSTARFIMAELERDSSDFRVSTLSLPSLIGRVRVTQKGLLAHKLGLNVSKEQDEVDSFRNQSKYVNKDDYNTWSEFVPGLSL